MCISVVKDSCKSVDDNFFLEPRRKNRDCKILSDVILKVVHLLNGIIFTLLIQTILSQVTV